MEVRLYCSLLHLLTDPCTGFNPNASLPDYVVPPRECSMSASRPTIDSLSAPEQPICGRLRTSKLRQASARKASSCRVCSGALPGMSSSNSSFAAASAEVPLRLILFANSFAFYGSSQHVTYRSIKPKEYTSLAFV